MHLAQDNYMFIETSRKELAYEIYVLYVLRLIKFEFKGRYFSRSE